MQVRNNEWEYTYFPASGIQEINEFIYMSLLETNGLVRVNVNTGLVQFIDIFKHESAEYQLYLQSVLYQDKIFFLPLNAKKIAVYDVSKSNMRYIETGNRAKPGRYINCVRDGKYLYLLSDREWHIDCLDMETEELTVCCRLDNDYERMGYTISAAINGYIFGISIDTNEIWRFNSCDKQYAKLGRLFEQEAPLNVGCAGDDCIWVISDNYIVYQLSLEGKCLRQYNIVFIVESLFGKKDVGAFECFFIKSILIITLYDKNCVIEIPVFENVLEIKKYKHKTFHNSLLCGSAFAVATASRIVFYEDALEKEVALKAEPDFLKKYMEKSSYEIRERNMYSMKLNDFIEYICSNEGIVKTYNGRDKRNIGESILYEENNVSLSRKRA